MSNAGSSTIKGPLIANGGATFSDNNFKIEIDTGNTDITGSLTVHNNVVIDKDIFIEGNLSCASGAFRMSEDIGSLRVDINGQLHVTGTTTYYDTFKLNNSNDQSVVSFSSRDDGKSYFLGGNVGFGISDPEFKVDVFGNINVSNGSTYKIGGVDVVFSQWETIFNTDIKFNSGNVFINIQEPSQTSDSKLVVGGNIKITSGGDLILNGKSFEKNVQDIIPESPWVNEPVGSTVEDKNITHLYSNYPVLLSKQMSIGIALDSKYALQVAGNTNMIGNLFFDGVEFVPNLWKTYDNPNANSKDAQYIYFTTANDPTPAISYVGIGTSNPSYNLDVNGDINITGNLLINGNGVIFPDPENGVITSAGWSEGPKTADGTPLYYNGGFIGIGTEIPETPLQVRGNINSNGNLLNIYGENYASYLTLTRTVTTAFQAALIGFTQNTNELLIQNTLADGSINISNSTGSGNIYMDVNGNIGIGTTLPKAKLHVKGAGIFDNDITIGSDGTSLIINNPTSVGKAETDTNSRIALKHATNDMLIMDPDSGYAGGIKLGGTVCIIPQSNSLKYVGIAKSTPEYQLDINGDLNYSQRLLKNGVEQFPSQWFTEYEGSEEYIYYPKTAGEVGSIARIGIGTVGKPNACLEVFDRKVSATEEYYPQLILKSSIDNYANYDQGTCIELNTYNTSDFTTYKGIRLRTIDEGLPSFVGLAIDTNNANSSVTPFVNLFYLNAIGNLGIGNFLNSNRQDVRARLHLLNPTTDQPAIIISDNNNPTNPELNVSDLSIICSKSNPSNLGKYSKIIGLNIEHAISSSNTLIQNSLASDARGAVAINLSAGGSQGGANTGGSNGSAFGVLFTDATKNAGAGVTLEEQFSIAYNGNVGIRSYSTTNATKEAPKFGLNINHRDDDVDATGRYTGSINISGFYYKDGKKLHLPWTYWKSDDPYDSQGNPVSISTYETQFDIGWANGSSSTLDTNIKTILKNNIHQLDSIVGIGTSQPRGALDVEGSIYSKYGVFCSDKYPNASLTLYHSRMEAIENLSAPTKYTLLSDANGDTWLNSQNNGSVWLTNDGSQTALYCTAGWVHIPNGIEGNLWCNGAVRIVGRLNIGRNDPGGGSGDQSFLEYVVVSGSDKEQTVLRIVCGNDANDNINLRPSGKVGIKTDQPSYTLHVNGDCGATQFYATSDYRLKNDVETLKDEKYNIDSLRPVSYTLKETQKPALGFIAHEVQEHFPEMVSGEKDGDEMMQAIEYNQMIPLLVKEIQELKARVKELESKQN